MNVPMKVKSVSVSSLITTPFQGPVSGLVTCCDVYGMPRPVCLCISTDVQGLSVTFETPKLFDLER